MHTGRTIHAGHAHADCDPYNTNVGPKLSQTRFHTWSLAPCCTLDTCPTVQCWEWEICNSKYKTYYSNYKCSCAIDQILNVINKVNDEGELIHY